MRRLRVVAAACLVLVVSGCVPDAGIPTLPPTPTVTPVFASEEEALAAAEDAYAAYLEMSDLIGSEGGADPERIDTVAAGELRDVARKGFDDFRDNAWSAVGSTTLVALVPQFVDATAPEGEPVVVAYVCIDVSGVDVLDASGDSVVSADRPPLQTFEVAFDFVGATLLPVAREPWGDLHPCDL